MPQARKCDQIFRSNYTDQPVPTCPHEFVTEYRLDRYPFALNRAICNCQRCKGPRYLHNGRENETMTFLMGYRFQCMPISVLRPVIIKGECQLNGEFNWIPTFERVSISCGCYENVEISRRYRRRL